MVVSRMIGVQPGLLSPRPGAPLQRRGAFSQLSPLVLVCATPRRPSRSPAFRMCVELEALAAPYIVLYSCN